MVVFTSAEDAQRTAEVMEASEARRLHKPEFKFSKCCDDVRDAFFGAVKHCRFTVRAIVVKKEVIYSARLKTDKERFYEFFVRQMMTWDGGILENARVVIDGSGDRDNPDWWRRSLQLRIGDVWEFK